MMRHGLLVLIVGFTLLGARARAETNGQQLAESAGRPLVGTPAPRLTLKTIDGATIDLGQLYGKQAVYLKFWATWCVPCRQQMPHFEKIYEAAGPDLAVIAINAGFNDSVDDIRAYQRKLGITMPIVLDDGRLGAAFHLRVTPQHIVIGCDGRIQYIGHLADSRLDAALLVARTSSATDVQTGTSRQTGTSSPGAPKGRHYDIGDRLPAQSVPLLDGTRVSLHDATDPRTTVLVFMSPWCESYLATTRPAVSANCRHMREQMGESADDQGARWLGIASGLWATRQDLHEYQRKYHVRTPLTLDGSGALFHAFDVNEVPTAIITDATGRILRRVQGNALDLPNALRSAIAGP